MPPLDLEKYVDQRFEDMRIYFDRVLAEQEKNVKASAHSLELRLENMNLFRAQLERERAQYLTRAEFDIHIADLERAATGRENRLRELENDRNRIWAFGSAVVFISGVITWIITRLFK